MNLRTVLIAIGLATAGAAQAFDVTRESLDAGGAQIEGDSRSGAVSADGRFVAFATTQSLLPGDGNSLEDVYLRDRQTGELRLLSAGQGLPTDRATRDPDISDDGRFVVFASSAGNLVPGDSNNAGDVFLYDRLNDELLRLTMGFDGSQTSGGSFSPVISGDGGVVAFTSAATNLVPDDTNDHQDVFVHVVLLGENRRVSVTSSGGQANGQSTEASISRDGRRVAFSSIAANLNPAGSDQLRQVYVHDLITGRTQRAATPDDTITRSDVFDDPNLSPDGNWIAFVRTRDGGIGLADVYLENLETEDIIRVTEPRGAPERSVPAIGGVSDEGRFVAYESAAENLFPGDANGEKDVIRFDRVAGENARVSGPGPNAGGSGESRALDISPDGRFVLFASRANNLVDGDTNRAEDIFLNDVPEFAIAAFVTGSWFDPALDGQGFNVEYLSGDRLLFYWFTFGPDGGREWIFGVLDVSGAVAEGQAFRKLGGRFPPAFDPDDITTPPWGTVRFEFTDCNSATVGWSNSAPFPEGSMNLTRLTAIPGLPCS